MILVRFYKNKLRDLALIESLLFTTRVKRILGSKVDQAISNELTLKIII